MYADDDNMIFREDGGFCPEAYGKMLSGSRDRDRDSDNDDDDDSSESNSNDNPDKRTVFIVVNPKSGSYKESITGAQIKIIVRTLDSHSSEQNVRAMTADLEQYPENKHVGKKSERFNPVILKTQYAGHAKKHFSELDEKTLRTTALIIGMGGDGIIHEIVNGLYENKSIRTDPMDPLDNSSNDLVDDLFDNLMNNQRYMKHLIPRIAICPTGSGNHLAKLVNTDSVDAFMKALTCFVKGEDKLKRIVPTEIETIVEVESSKVESKQTIQNTVQHPAQRSGSVLSINTIIGGIPESTNSTATCIAPYIPSAVSSLKYELATVWNLFSRKYLSIETDSGEKIDGIVGLFVQTTPSCGNKFIVDSTIDGEETGLTYGYIKDMYSLHMAFELLKEKSGVKSSYFIRRYDKDEHVILRGSETTSVTVDGQDEPVSLPAKIRKARIMLSFLTQ